MRYAELPNGKMLKFDDHVTDAEMKRAVRNELGLASEDILDEIASLTKKMDSLHKETTARQEKTEKQIGPMIDAFKQLSKTLDGVAASLDLQGFQSTQLNKTLKAVEDTSDSAAKTIAKGFSALQQSLDRHNKSIAELCESMQGAIEHSTEAIQADLKASMKAVSATTDTAKRIEEWAIAQKARDSEKRGKRHAYRNQDGSWTLEG
jgi:predicted ribosome quality control (RQC) complex YloA/Tae2 family protein